MMRQTFLLSLMAMVGVVSFVAKAWSQQEQPPPIGASIADSVHVSRNGLTVYAQAATKWEKDVARLASENTALSDQNAILFLGSSSIQRWDSIAECITPYKPVRRGYGGAKYCDLAIYTPNLINSLSFRAAVVFVGNDISGKVDDKEPAEIARLAKVVIESIRKENSRSPVILVSVTATPARFAYWARIEEANQALKALASKTRDVYFLDTKGSYLDDSDRPKPDRFVEDGLHQNEKGYKVWGSLIRDKLDEVLKR